VVTYLNCGRDVIRFGSTEQPLGEAVVVADPAFNMNPVRDEECRSVDPLVPDGPRREQFAGMRFGPLDGSRNEGESIAQLLAVRALVRADARKNRVTASLSPHILHLATHSYFLPEANAGDPPTEPIDLERVFAGTAMLRSGLVFAGVNTWIAGGALPRDADNGILTAYDV
jgi:hypothetical protein